MSGTVFQIASIFQDHMILQREKQIAVWGNGKPGEVVYVSIQGQQSTGQIDGDGHWKLFLSGLKASLGETMTVTCGQEERVFSDIAVGEVWLAGGQSNMEFQLCFEKHWNEESVCPPNENLRFYDVPKLAYPGQENDFDYSRAGVWRKANPEDLKCFSAVGYYFQKQLQRELNVPVGIVGCNWGGTGSSVWMSKDSVERLNNYWWKKYLSQSEGINWEEFYGKQKDIPLNDRGNLIEDNFTKTIMPGTKSEAEIWQVLSRLPKPDFTVLMPEKVPGALFERMVKKVAQFAIRGVLWYQGESDDEGPERSIYEDMLKALIADWRALWGDEKLPFLIVQLPGWDRWLFAQNEQYSVIRNCQEAVTEQVENTWLCSISDAGDQYDIHPKNKKIVGERLVLLAEGHVYGKQMLCDAPRMKNARREGTRCYLTFVNADGGLSVEGDAINALRIVQEGVELDYSFAVDGDTLILDVGENANPVSIHFADTKWFAVNLYNRMHVPAIPFTVCV